MQRREEAGMNRAMRKDGFSKIEQTKESVCSNRSAPPILTKTGIMVVALLAAVAVQAGTHTAESAAVTVDTRDAVVTSGDYLVIDLRGGTNAASYPVRYTNAVPTGGWTDIYKTDLMVMRRIPAGKFTMGSPTNELGRSSNEPQHTVTLSKDFYVGVFEVTQRQWELVMGNRPSYFNNDSYYATRPVEQVSYFIIRENPANSGAISPNWPASSQVHTDSFMGRLRSKTGLDTFDLPTEAQWEYACRAGSTNALNSGKDLTSTGQDANMDEVGRYFENGGNGGYMSSVDTSAGTSKAGSYLPNAWGLYDMHGNVAEWCLDWYETYPSTSIDPKGAVSGSYRMYRSGASYFLAKNCRAAYRNAATPQTASEGSGFRAAFTMASVVSPTNLTPSLSWSAVSGYDGARGVSPQSGVVGSTFTFKVVYQDGNGDAPAAGYPRVIVRSNNVDRAYTLAAEPGGSYAGGMSYTKTLVLLSGSYGYRFEALDSNGAVATGSPVGQAQGPFVSAATLTLSSGSVSIPPAGGIGTFDVRANVNWTAVVSQAWITLTDGLSGSGNGTVRYTVAANNQTGTRSGTVTVVGGGMSRTHTVSQTAFVKMTVMFNGSGVSVSPASATVTNGLAYGVLPMPTRTGYTFGGWWTGSGGTGTQVMSGTTVTATGNHTLYAKWTVVHLATVSVQADPADGGQVSIAGGGVSVTLPSGSSVVVSAAANPDWKFICWSDGNTAVVRDFTVLNENTTLIAQFAYAAVVPLDAPVLMECTRGNFAMADRIEGFFRPVSGAETYEVYRSNNQNEYGESVQVSVSRNTVDSHKFSHAGLPQGDKAWYRVRAVSNGVASAFSASAYGETSVALASVKAPRIRIIDGVTNAVGAFRGSVTMDIVGYQDDAAIRYLLTDENKAKTFTANFTVKVVEPGTSRTFGVAAWQEKCGDRTDSGSDIELDRGKGPSVKTVTVVSETVRIAASVKCADGSVASGYTVSFGGISTKTDWHGKFELIVALGTQGCLTIHGINGHQDMTETISSLTGNTSLGTYVLVKIPKINMLEVSPGKTRTSGRIGATWSVADPSRLISSYQLVINKGGGVVYNVTHPATTKSVPIIASSTPGLYEVVLYAYYLVDGEEQTQQMTTSFNVLGLNALKRRRVEVTNTKSAAIYLERNVWNYPYEPEGWNIEKSFLAALNGADETMAQFLWGGLRVPDSLFNYVYGVLDFDLSAESWWSYFLSGAGVEEMQDAKLYLCTQRVKDADDSKEVLYIGGRADGSFYPSTVANLSGWTSLASTRVDIGFWNSWVDKDIWASLDAVEFGRLLNDTRTQNGRLYFSMQASSGFAAMFHGSDAPAEKRPYLELDFSYTSTVQASNQRANNLLAAPLSSESLLPDYASALDWYYKGELTELGVLSAAISHQAFDSSLPEDMTVSRHLSAVTNYIQEQTVRIEIVVPEGQCVKSGILVERIPEGYQYAGLNAVGEACRADELIGNRLAIHFINLAAGTHVQEYQLIPIMGRVVPYADVFGSWYFVDESNRVGVQAVTGDKVMRSGVDTDSDGLCDSDEVAAGTDMFAEDTDGDGLKDGFEAQIGTDPLDPSSANVLPRITKRSPIGGSVTASEGSLISFSLTADDANDPVLVLQGMSNVTWYVDGELKQVTKTGAPNAITSAFTFKTAADTVQGAAVRDVAIRAVAVDKTGGTASTNWTVRVNNVPAPQTIKFATLPVKALGDPDSAAGATVSSGLPLVYSNSNPAVAEMVGGQIHVVSAGTTVITASQPGNFDFKAAASVRQPLTVKARLTTAAVPSADGTVTGAGLYLPGTKVALTAKPATGRTFLRWEDGSQTTSRSLLMPNANTAVTAWFGITTNVPKPEIADPGTQRAMVGVSFNLPLEIFSESLPLVTLTGLPSGLAYVPASKSVAGVPLAPVTNRLVTVKAVNVNKTPATQTFTMTVDPLPAWAQGTFSGMAGTEAHGPGAASMSVTALGAVSGKLTLRGTNLNFSAKSYLRRDEVGAFWVTTTASVTKVAMPLTLAIRNPEEVEDDPPNLSIADGWFNVTAEGEPEATLYRNVWKDLGMAAVVSNYTGYYTASLPGGDEYGSGYLTLTVDKLGGVKTTGKLADGIAVSLAGTLILDEVGRVFAVLYTAPATYQGGGLFGLAEFYKADTASRVVVRLLDGNAFVWENLNPQATSAYGYGFMREQGFAGGWYDTIGNLYDYYRDRSLSVSTEGMPEPELLVGTNRISSVCWDPNGLALTVATNKLGVMTGLAAPKAGVPVMVGAAYDYTHPTNAIGLSIALIRATGVFKGSFKAWFDYGSTHAAKSVAYEGVLTPERENADDGCAGRGFFLWPDKTQYLNPQNKPVPYNFNWSYDFKILLGDLVEDPPGGGTVEIPREGLVAEYLFSGNTNDTSGLEHHLTNKAASLAKNRKNVSNTAYAFHNNSGTSYMTGPDEDVLFGSGPEEFSVSMWMLYQGANGAKHMLIATYDAEVADQSYALGLSLGANGCLNAASRGGLSGGGVDDSEVDFSENGEIKAGSWYHVGFVFSKSARVFRCYLDGELRQTCALNANADYTDGGRLFIGSHRYLNEMRSGFEGVLDDIRIYNRVLSNTEMRDLSRE